MWFADLDTESISDTGSSTTVLVVTLLLVAFGVGLAVVTAWFWRETAPDPEALGPLSVMSRRRFASLGPIEQRRLMDEARPGFVPTANPDVERAGTQVDGGAEAGDEVGRDDRHDDEHGDEHDAEYDDAEVARDVATTDPGFDDADQPDDKSFDEFPEGSDGFDESKTSRPLIDPLLGR